MPKHKLEDGVEALTAEELRKELAKRGLRAASRYKKGLVERMTKALEYEKARDEKNGNTKPAQKRRRRAPTEQAAEGDGSLDPAVVLQSEILPLIMSFLPLRDIASCTRVSKAWKGASDTHDIWVAMFSAASLVEFVPRAEFSSAKMWFQCHFIASTSTRGFPDGSPLTRDDLPWTDLERGSRRRCGFCKYSVLVNSFTLYVDTGAMSWSCVHFACWWRHFRPKLSWTEFRLPLEKVAPTDAVNFVKWLLCGMTAELLPRAFGVPVPSWKPVANYPW